MSEILERELRETDLGAALLDEMYDFVGRYVSATPDQLTAIVLYAAATHIIHVCATFPHLLFASAREESGKTLAMQVCASLCSRILNASGTSYALDAALLEASQQPEMPVPTVIKDEISDIFGRDGFGSGGANKQLVAVLREGYKKGATLSRARRGVREEYSIFVPFIMTGLRTSVPRDIRTRTIVITMEPGRPGEYFDVRDAEQTAKRNGAALAQAVRAMAPEIAEFRARTLGVPGLVNRKAEVWEPLFAVASCLGGPRWLNKAVSAFRALALAEVAKPVLTERQRTLQAAAELAPGLTLDGFVPGLALADELRRLDDPLFQGRSEIGAAKLIANAMPVDSRQRVMPSGDRMRGYYLNDILGAWEAVAPPDLDEEDFEEEVNPFEVTDGEDDDDPPPWEDADAKVTAPLPAAPAQAPPRVPPTALQALAKPQRVRAHCRPGHEGRAPEDRCKDCPLRAAGAGRA